MRGFPPVHLLLLAIVFAVIAVPLMKLTSAGPGQPVARVEPQAAKTESPKVSSWLRIRFAHQPISLSIKLGDQELVSDGSLKESPIEKQMDLTIPEDGIELLVTGRWPEGTPDTALTIDLEPNGLETQSHTRWSFGNEMNEVIPFQWK